MPKTTADGYETKLRSRFRVALAFAQGDLGWADYGPASETLGISEKTLKRDIKRASKHQMFENWRPGKTGPKKGSRRAGPQVMGIIAEHVYANESAPLNIAKLARDVEHELHNRGVRATDIPSPSTVERIVKDIETADPAHFAWRRHGRLGRRRHSVQRGSLETTRPLEIVCIDHTPLDHRTFVLGGEEVVVRPTATAVMDLHTTVSLAAFVSLHPPSATTVALAMALSAINKTEVLKKYGVPGEWEASGLGETLYVDGAAELTSDAVQSACDRYNIELRVGLPGRPERRGRMERLWRTLNSEVHSWEGSTLSNTEHLKEHGGQKPPVWDLEEVQRRFLLAVMEYNNENYGGPKLPPIMQWRDQSSNAAVNRRIPHDPQRVFVDFLPSDKREVTFEGIRFANCFFRSGEIAKLQYEGVKSVTIRYDPRDVRKVWIETEAGYTAIPRVHPKHAPAELFALRHWGRRQSQIAQEKKDSELLRAIAAAKKIKPSRWSIFKEFDESELSSQEVKEEIWRPAVTQGKDVSAADHRSDVGLPADFSIPEFKARLK